MDFHPKDKEIPNKQRGVEKRGLRENYVMAF